MNAGRFAQALGSAMGARLAMAALNYALFWVLSHRFAAADLGGFSLLMNVFLLVQYLPLLGLSIPLMRRVATEPEHLAREVSNAMAFALPVGAGIAVLVAIDGWWTHPEALFWPFALVALSVLPSAWIAVVETVVVAQERMAYMARVQCVEALLRTGLALALVETGHGLTAVFCVFFGVRCAIALLYRLRSGVPAARLSLLSAALQRRNLHEVPVYLGITVLVALSARLDVILLARLKGLADVATYASASRLYEASLMLPTMVALVLFPTLSRLLQQQRQRFGGQLALALRACLGFGLVAAFAIAACAQPVIDLLYPPQMAAAASVLRWLIFGAVLMTLDQILSSTMVAAQAPSQDLASLCLGAGALVLGLLLLVPLFGAAGAAASVTLALSVRVMWRLRWAAQSLHLPQLRRDLLRLALAAAAGVAALLWSLQFSPLAALCATLAAYGVSARLAGVIGSHPVQDLRAGLFRLTGRSEA